MAGRRRGLTPEERELWSRITNSAKALHPAQKQSEPRTDSPILPKPTKIRSAVPPDLSRFQIGQTARPAASSNDLASGPAEQLAAASLRMDKKAFKRMTQGKMRPEARLDLHGMTLAEAQPELIRFILSCKANGLRLVIVITGKGRGDHGPLPTRPGALRHQVPFWLARIPLASVVQQVTAAHFRHGGEGAYYVYLRR